jgi:hypothetical protein
MPAVINPVTSLIGGPQWQPIVYQPSATGLPAAEVAADFDAFPVVAATATALGNSPVYNNGTAGVGATLTAGTNGALVIDGYSPEAGDAVLVKDESATPRNGVYTVTNAGSAGSLYVLTRHTSFNTPAKLQGYVVPTFGTQAGRVYAWPRVTSIGTAIVFAAWSTRWRCSALPKGGTINPATGRIRVVGEEPGVYNVTLQAWDGAEWSAGVTFPIAIEAAPFTVSSGPLLYIDTATLDVSLGNGSTDGAATSASGPLVTVKSGDDLLLAVQFRNGGAVIDPGSLSSLKLGIKRWDAEPLVEQGGGTSADSAPNTMGKIGSGASATFLLWAKFDSADLENALADDESETETEIIGAAEIEWVALNTTGVGPSDLRKTSKSFPIRIVRQKIV